MPITRGQMKRQLRMGGGIMNVVPRDKALFGGIKKAVKKAVKGVKDIASSDLGKAAITGAVLFGIPGMGTAGGLGGGLLGRASFGGAAPGVFGLGGIGNLFAAGGVKDPITKKAVKDIGLKKTLGILAGGSLLGTLAAGVEAGDEEAIEASRNVDALKTYLRQGYRNLKSFVKEDGTEDAEALEAQVNRDVSEYTAGAGGYAEGGRIKYAMGDSASDNAMQAAGIEGLPIRQNPKGVKELDLRNTGGFIPPVGIKEKEDDIPAMLSNNEFVFTADAVRSMGDGDVNKGAERMYSMMKTLEAGGRV
jgi:hypothetical protein